MTDFEYLGEVKLGSNVATKPLPKKKSLAYRLVVLFVSGVALSAGFFFGNLAIAQIQKHNGGNTNGLAVVPSPSNSASADGSTPTPSIVLDRGSYQIAGAPSSGAKKTKAKNKVTKKPGPKITSTPTPEPSGYYVPRRTPTPTPTPSRHPGPHPSPTPTPTPGHHPRQQIPKISSKSSAALRQLLSVHTLGLSRLYWR